MLRTSIALVGALTVSATAIGQVVLEPPRYQYGRYNEVFYGGRNPTFTSNAYVYLPPALQVPYAAQRRDTPWILNGYTPMGPGTPFVSPYNQESTAPQYAPYIFTDYLPFVEAGQFGFTVDQARNEAYANVPRIQTGGSADPATWTGPGDGNTASPAEPVAATPPADPKSKAIPLLNWAKAERTRNPALFRALVGEARKYDPVAAASLEGSSASER